ncbi:MAG: phosphate--acyl-ACP acyltransferase [Bacteroidia bacterium]
MRIGVDIMGGDFAPVAPIEGALLAAAHLGERATVVLIGDEAIIRKELEARGHNPAAFSIVHTDQAIGMDESPTKAVVSKPRATINMGIGMVKQGQLDGFVSAGNTGAMLVASVMGLGKIEGVMRPTIGVMVEIGGGKKALLCDVGANVDCKPEVLFQFGLLAKVYLESVHKLEDPRIGLLNVGEEEGKGPDVVKATYSLMKSTDRYRFVGNVEGRDIYRGHADAFICDGFTGNIVLKFGESMYELLKGRFPGDSFIETFNFENYGGVPVLGVKGISIIGHGISTAKATESMILSAVTAAESGLVGKIEAAFASSQSDSPIIV